MDIRFLDPTVDPRTLPWKEEEQITEQHMNDIGRVILNWGKADTFLGLALCFLYNLDGDNAADLLHVLDFKKKVDYLKKKTKKIPPCDGFDKLITEMHFCISNYKWERDAISHGTVMYNHDGKGEFMSMKNTEQKISLSALKLVLERSRYTLDVSIAILKVLAGEPISLLSVRPT